MEIKTSSSYHECAYKSCGSMTNQIFIFEAFNSTLIGYNDLISEKMWSSLNTDVDSPKKKDSTEADSAYWMIPGCDAHIDNLSKKSKKVV